MATQTQKQVSFATVLPVLVHAEGSAGHRYSRSDSLVRGREVARNLADVIHYLCALHGRHPGVVDHSAVRTAFPAAREWLLKAVDGFTVERTYLTRLVVAAGPLPSTMGQDKADAAVEGQRHALDMLAQSDREGCALGAAAALVLDWQGIRPLLDRAAERFGVAAAPSFLPCADTTTALLEIISGEDRIDRALQFGADQLLNQHRGMWDLLEARQTTRLA